LKHRKQYQVKLQL